MSALADEGIETRPFFYPLHTLPMYRAANEGKVFPGGRRPRASGCQPPVFGDAHARPTSLTCASGCGARVIMRRQPAVELAGYLGSAVGVGEAARLLSGALRSAGVAVVSVMSHFLVGTAS